MTATQWSTVEDKWNFVRQFQAFVKSGFAFTKFPKWFYQRLSNTFGHIAHYDQGGFYDNFFRQTAGKVAFVEQCLRWECFGQPEFTFCDAEREIQTWLKDEDIAGQLRRQLAREIEVGERRLLAQLQAKYQRAADVEDIEKAQAFTCPS